MITKNEFEEAIKNMVEDNDIEVTWLKVGETNKRKDIAIVLGWSSQYDEGQLYQMKHGETIYTLVGKVAYNCDDLQYDYEFDWHMPKIIENGDILDTNHAIDSDSYEFLNMQAEKIVQEYKQNELEMDE